MQPLIGLTTYARDEQNRVHLPADYIDAVIRAGGVPVLLPPVDVDVNVWLDRCDGLILCGGGDIDPVSYGGATHQTNYMMDRQRDENELAMARNVVQNGLPTLAICRGAQIVNLALGGTLIAHIPDEFGDSIPHRLPPRKPVPHAVSVRPDSRLAEILECSECSPISWHHQAICSPGQQLRVTAHAPDGVIEAFELPDHPWLIAVQWHPELSAADDPIQQRLFDCFIRAAATRQD